MSKTIPAHDFCNSVFDGTHDTPKPCENGHPLILSKNIQGNSINLQDTYNISEEDYNAINARSKVSQWDILFSMIGTVGSVYLEKSKNIPYAIKNMGVFSTKDELKAKWLYYYLQTNEAKFIISNYLNGAVQKFLPLGFLREFPVREMPQNAKEIISVLENIDSKIDNNNAIAAELEGVAKDIYDYWFVQFDFPDENGKPYKSSGGKMVWNEELKREIPEGWESTHFSEVLDIFNGKDHQHLSDGEIPVYGSGGLMRRVSECLYDGEAILIPRKGTLNNIMYVDEPFWTVDTMFYSKAKACNSALYLYYTLRQYDFEKLNTGSAVPSMTMSTIYSLKLVSPPQRLLESFNKKAKMWIDSLSEYRKENATLESLRDFLLPMLMNGQVKVKGA